MSLRPSTASNQGSVVDATFAAARHVTGGRRSARLDEVLRAGRVVGTPFVAHGLSTAATNSDDPTAAGLTRSLKNASLVPTGACLPRGFDSDYCAYDGYYVIGLTLVSVVVGALFDSPHTWAGYGQVAKALNQVLGQMCHTPEEDGWIYANPQTKKYHEMNRNEKINANKRFGSLCHMLDVQLSNEGQSGEIFGDEGGSDSWRGLAGKIFWLITRPGNQLFSMLNTLANPVAENQPTSQRTETVQNVAMLVSATQSLRYISHFMNEHAMMIASFFRVNAKKLRDGDRLVLNLATFARQCKEDIAKRPNPPPAPPDYEEFDPAAVRVERRKADRQRHAEERRKADLQRRAESRKADLQRRAEICDPAMECVDYPPIYASSAGDAPLRDLHSGAPLGR